MRNFLYNYLSEATPSLLHEDREGNNFVKISLAEPETTTIPEPHTLKEHHISVYEGNDGYDNQYHYTATILTSDEQRFKAHCFFNHHDRLTSISFSNRPRPIDINDDEPLVAFIRRTAVISQSNYILPLKEKLNKKVSKLEAKCNALLQAAEEVSLTDKTRYLGELRKIKEVVVQLTPLVSATHPLLSSGKMVSNIIKSIEEEKKEKVVRSSNKIPDSRAASGDQFRKTTPTSTSSSQIVIALKQATKNDQNTKVQKFNTETTVKLSQINPTQSTPPSQLFQWVTQITDLLPEINATILTAEDISSENMKNLYNIYNQVWPIGGRLLRMLLQTNDLTLRHVKEAQKMRAFYHLLTKDDLTHALSHQHYATIHFLLNECGVPVRKWEVTINEITYASAIHYLISGNLNDNTINLLIFIITYNFSILKTDVRLLSQLLLTEDKLLKRVMESSEIQHLTICDKAFFNTVKPNLSKQALARITELKSQGVVAPAKEKKIRETSLLFAQRMSRLGDSFNNAFNSKEISELRAQTLEQTKSLLNRITATWDTLSEVARFQATNQYRAAIMFPESDVVDFDTQFTINNVNLMDKSYERLSRLESSEIITQLMETYNYTSQVLSLLVQICDLYVRKAQQVQEKKPLKTIESEFDRNKASLEEEIKVLVVRRRQQLQSLEAFGEGMIKEASSEKPLVPAIMEDELETEPGEKSSRELLPSFEDSAAGMLEKTEGIVAPAMTREPHDDTTEPEDATGLTFIGSCPML